jgi:hydrogenase maturation protein HypF
VALSGGVFQNRLLFSQVVNALHKNGLNVLTHKLVPSNDGGIALGQAVIAGLAGCK